MYEELLACARLPTLYNRCQQDTATLMRSFSCDVTELISTMLVHIRVMCFSKKYMQTESKVIILLSSQSKIMASEGKKNSSSDADNVLPIPLPDYAKKLDGKVRKCYMKKISTIGINPALIEGKHFEPDCLLPIESTDLLCYLVLETSFYMQKQFKAFRSLEAYNQIVSKLLLSVLMKSP